MTATVKPSSTDATDPALARWRNLRIIETTPQREAQLREAIKRARLKARTRRP
jgi:hypothetical protein